MPDLGSFLPVNHEEPTGGSSSSPAPGVTILKPESVDVSGGPSLLVQWSIEEHWGITPTTYRVRVLSGNSVLFDSGLRSGSDTQYIIADAAASLPSGQSLTVEVQAGAGSLVAPVITTATKAFQLSWGGPTIVLGTVQYFTTPFIVVSWTYDDTIVQQSWRVGVRNDQGVEVWASGWQEGAATSVPVSVSLPSGEWRVAAQVRNASGVPSPEVSSIFTVDVSEPLGSVADLFLDVGTISEVGIQGIPFMLYDNRDDRQDWRWGRRHVPLDAPRFSTSDTPFNEAFDRYTFVGQGDWAGGAGQTWAQRDDSDDQAFFQSWGIDPFTDLDGVTLLPETETMSASGTVTKIVTAGSFLYWLTDVGNLYRIGTWDDPLGPTLVESGYGANADLSSNGSDVFVSEPGELVESGSDTMTDYGSTGNEADICEWAADQLFVAYPDGSTSTNRIDRLDPTTGAPVEIAGLLILPDGWDITSIAGGSGFVWFCASSADQSAIYSWNASGDDAPIQAAKMPAGDRALEVFEYQSTLFVRAEGDTGEVQLWRGVITTDGKLSLFLVTDQLGPGGSGMVAEGSRVLFGWPSMGPNGESGLGCVNLVTGGWSRWVYDDSTDPVQGATRWQGRLVFGVGTELVRESDTTVSTGWIETSMYDGGGSGLSKVWDTAYVTTAPLPVGATVETSITYDQRLTYETVGSSLSEAGSRGGDWGLLGSAREAAMRITLNAGTLFAPTVQNVQIRMHPKGLSDQVLTMPIACFDRVAGLNEKELPLQSGQQGAGRRATALLESWVNELLLIQDVDWTADGEAHLYELLGIDLQKVSLMDPHEGRNSIGFVTVLALRRAN